MTTINQLPHNKRLEPVTKTGPNATTMQAMAKNGADASAIGKKPIIFQRRHRGYGRFRRGVATSRCQRRKINVARPRDVIGHGSSGDNRLYAL